MPNRCTFCTIVRPTNHLLLPTPLGLNWIEFCEPCGEKEIITHNTTDGDITIHSIREAHDILKQERLGSS